MLSKPIAMPILKNWTSGEFHTLRQHGDPLADQVIADIISSGDTEGINQLFSQLRENDDVSTIDFPNLVKKYFEDSAQLPNWIDYHQVKIGQQVFSKYGPEISLCLLTKSLPEAYACANGAKVLYATGRLTEQNGSLEVFTRRLMETSQFVVNVNSKKGLEPKGKGIVTAQKVRLIHAAIRYYLRKHNWPEELYGAPVNQQDLAGTLQSFSTLTLQGLEVLNIQLSEEEKQGYYHSWRVIGHIMGLKDELNPEKYQEGLHLGESILKNQMAPSKEGAELTQAVCQFMENMMPGHLFDKAPEAIIRHMIGEDISEILKLDSHLNLLDKLVPNLVGVVFKSVDEFTESHQRIERIAEHVKKYLLQHMLNHFNKNKKVKFYIPPSLRKDWNIED